MIRNASPACAAGSVNFRNSARSWEWTDEDYFSGETPHYELDESAVHMVRDNNKCILCRRCSAVCEKVQSVGVIGPNNRGFATFIGSAVRYGAWRYELRILRASRYLRPVLPEHSTRRAILTTFSK